MSDTIPAVTRAVIRQVPSLPLLRHWGHLLRTQLTPARFRFRHARCREADSAWAADPCWQPNFQPHPRARGLYCTAMPFPRLLLGSFPSARLLEGGHSHLPVRSITMRAKAISRLRPGSLKQAVSS